MKHLMSKLIVAGFALSGIGITAAADLTRNQVKTKLEAAGYTDVRGIRREGTHFDAKATTKDGKQVSLDVNAQTGAITMEKDGKAEERERGNKE